MIPKEVIEDYELESYKNEWLRGLVDLPNRTFLHFFKEVNGYVINITIQNYENKEIIDKLLTIVDKEIIKKEIDFSKIKLRKIKLDGVESFDNLIFASFEYSLLPNSDFVKFDKKRVNIYPIYNYELTGEESKKDIKSITRKVLSTTEWNREPVPLVRYKFTNPKHQYGTVGKSLVIDKEE
ncbi:hypothetical protein, partial [Tenacibaculum finnmarkense]|uniref:hypothetical protein n=1 Tax=Tenacibaculum finnmarkense TaxID=2781243 RepID=UPI001E347047